MSKDKQGLGEQAISKAAEIGFSSQLDEAKELDVEIEINPLEALQGKVDSVSVKGKKLVQGDLHLEEMEMHIDSINIDAMSAAFGNIKLTKPTDATARFVLTEKDISRALNSELMHNQLQNLKVQVDGQPMTLDVQQADIFLPGNERIGVKAEVFLQEASETHLIAFTAVPSLDRNRGTISLKNAQYSEGEDISPNLTKTLQDKITKLLEMRDFVLEGMSIHITSIEVQKDSITIQSESHVERLPSWAWLWSRMIWSNWPIKTVMTFYLNKLPDSCPNVATLVDLLRCRANQEPHKTAYIFLADGEIEAASLTYQELDRWSQAIASQLQSLDTAGERALLLYPPGLEFITAFFGCLYAKVVPIPAGCVAKTSWGQAIFINPYYLLGNSEKLRH